MPYFNGTIVHIDRGLNKPYARAYHGHVDRRYRLFHVDSEYACGRYPANYPMPAIPLQVKYNYIGCVNIDDMTDPDDPIIVWMWDSWTQRNV